MGFWAGKLEKEVEMHKKGNGKQVWGEGGRNVQRGKPADILEWFVIQTEDAELKLSCAVTEERA